MAKGLTGVRPIGAVDECPLVVKTADLAVLVNKHLETNAKGRPLYESLVRRIKTCKERGQIVHGVSYEVLKRIVEEDALTTSDTCADEILIATGEYDLLGKEITLYRNPAMDDDKYEKIMKARLQDEDWVEEVDTEYIESFPKLSNTPL